MTSGPTTPTTASDPTCTRSVRRPGSRSPGTRRRTIRGTTALWFTIKFVNEENFWEEYDAYGVLRHVDTTTVHWIRPDRETVVIVDERTLTHVELGDDAYAIDWDITLTPQVDVVLDRTEFTTWGGYGGLALRGRGDWTDTRLLLVRRHGARAAARRARRLAAT